MNPSRLMGWMEVLMTAFSLLDAINALGKDVVFLSKPKNVAVITGQRMEMECRTDNESKVAAWYFAPSTSTTSPVTLVANNGPKIQFSKNVSSEFGVDFDANGSGIIYLNVTTMNDSGLYTCEVEANSNVMKFSAQLIVFDAPICETNNLTRNVEEAFWMRCRVQFRGNCTPVVEWTKYITGNGTEIPVADGNETVIGNGSVTSTLTVNGRSISLGVSFYSFKIFFFQMNSSGKGNASNSPEFSYKFPVDSIVFLSTVSPVSPIGPTIDASISKETTTGLAVETVYLMIIVVVGVLFFVLSLVIVLVCWIFVRRRTAAWMANIVSSYENADRRSRVNRRSTTDCQRRETDVTCSADASIEIEQRCRPTSDGYTDANDLQEADNMTLEVKLRPASDGYTDADDIQEETLIASRSDHALDENSELYATLRKNVEPPRCLSIYTS